MIPALSRDEAPPNMDVMLPVVNLVVEEYPYHISDVVPS